MFTPVNATCRVDRSNMALFYPDRLAYTIDAATTFGWYVLFAPYISASAELVYVPTGGGNYLGYSTKPSPSANRPNATAEITTGKCTIAWASVEDGFNNPYKTEDTNAQAQDIIYLTGRTNTQVGSDRQVFGLYLQSGWFDRSTLGLAQYNSAIKVIVRVRHSPSDVLFRVSNVFGYAINLISREISSYAPAPQYPLATTAGGTDIGSYQPTFLSLTPAGGILAVVLAAPTPISITLRLYLGATRFDTFTASVSIEDCAIDNIDLYLPTGTTKFSIRAKLPIQGAYQPILHKTPILGWI